MAQTNIEQLKTMRVDNQMLHDSKLHDYETQIAIQRKLLTGVGAHLYSQTVQLASEQNWRAMRNRLQLDFDKELQRAQDGLDDRCELARLVKVAETIERLENAALKLFEQAAEEREAQQLLRGQHLALKVKSCDLIRRKLHSMIAADPEAEANMEKQSQKIAMLRRSLSFLTRKVDGKAIPRPENVSENGKVLGLQMKFLKKWYGAPLIEEMWRREASRLQAFLEISHHMEDTNTICLDRIRKHAPQGANEHFSRTVLSMADRELHQRQHCLLTSVNQYHAALRALRSIRVGVGLSE